MQKLFHSCSSDTQNPQSSKAHRSHIRVCLDSLLKQDIEILQQHQTYQEVPIKRLKLPQNNALIREYVSSNYKEYQINDPLPHMSLKHVRCKTEYSNQTDQKRETQQRVKNKAGGPRKIIKLESHKTRQKIKTQPYEQSTKYRTATQYEEKSEEVPTKKIVGIKKSPKKSTDERLQTRYSTSSPMNQRYLTKQFSIQEEQKSQFENIEVLSSRIIGHPFQNTDQKNSKRTQEIRHKPISETFRYCVGCEKAILEANIKYHESICRSFQEIIELRLDQILSIIDNKIDGFEDSIQYLSKSQHLNNSFKNLCQNLVSESKISRKKGSCSANFSQTHQQIKDSLESSTLLLENISKLNWFMKIRENILKNVT